MGLMAESMIAYAQPLLDKTDGSHEQVQYALSIAQMCWNLALLPEKERIESLARMQPALGMNEEEFLDFSETVIVPMIKRHHEMFPNMSPPDTRQASTRPSRDKTRYLGTGRNEPCPCGSGKKYKRCCGR